MVKTNLIGSSPRTKTDLDSFSDGAARANGGIQFWFSRPMAGSFVATPCSLSPAEQRYPSPATFGLVRKLRLPVSNQIPNEAFHSSDLVRGKWCCRSGRSS